MANQLINGTEAASAPPQESAPEGEATWVYDAVTGAGRLIYLKAGESIPAGTVDSPAKAGQPAPSEPTKKTRKEQT